MTQLLACCAAHIYNTSNKSIELWFKFNYKLAQLSIYEFSIVTGLACGQKPLQLLDEATKVCLRDTYFKMNEIKTTDLLRKYSKMA